MSYEGCCEGGCSLYPMEEGSIMLTQVHLFPENEAGLCFLYQGWVVLYLACGKQAGKLAHVWSQMGQAHRDSIFVCSFQMF